METVLTFKGREITGDHVAFIRDLIAQEPQARRRALSFKICEAWGWAQPNGAPCDVLCRALMLVLHRAGHIVLPPPQWVRTQAPRRSVLPHVDVDATPLDVPLAELGPIEIRQVRRTPDEALVDSLLHQHHYLGHVRPVGECLKYLVTVQHGTERRPIACFFWSSAPRHLGPRDRYIGWSKEARKAHIRFVAYQPRFLILPWVHVPHLASHLLGRMSRQLSADWERVYAHPIHYVETFVDPDRFRGTCYRAANWTLLGMTTGRGKDDQTKVANRSLKQVYGYALSKDFRRRLCEGASVVAGAPKGAGSEGRA